MEKVDNIFRLLGQEKDNFLQDLKAPQSDQRYTVDPELIQKGKTESLPI
jgi:hypothetical protein